MEKGNNIHAKITEYFPKQTKEGNKAVHAEVHGKLLTLLYDLGDDDKQNRQQIIKIKEYIKSVENHYESNAFVNLSLFLDNLLDLKISSVVDAERLEIPQAFFDSLIIDRRDKVILTNYAFTNRELSELSKMYYQETNRLLFTIPKTKKMEGKVVGTLRNSNKQKVPLVFLHKIAGGDNPIFEPFLFYENGANRKNAKKELTGEFYLYRFVSNEDVNYTILSLEKLNTETYVMEGTEFEIHDSSLISETSKLQLKYKIFFVHSASPTISQFIDHDEFFAFCKELELSQANFLDYLDSHKNEAEIRIFPQPFWFNKFMCAFIFHAKKGSTDKYPLHLLWLSPRGAGKTTFLESLSTKFGCHVVDGATSTTKYIIPSFKEKGSPEVGELAKAHRLFIIDEFFRMLLKSKQTERDVECARMNTILEHKERSAGSGHGATQVKMTARMIASTNPIIGCNDINNLLDKFDDSFISRMITYYQTPEHIKFINDNKKKKFVSGTYWIEKDKFLAIVDYLQSFDATYDWNRLVKIFEKFSTPMSEKVKGLFESRYLHHMECLLDGLIKTRCLFEGDISFSAKEEDYLELEDLMGRIIGSWFYDSRDIIIDTKISADARMMYLPEHAKVILDILDKMGKQSKLLDLASRCLPEMSEPMFYSMLSLLKTGEFLTEKDNRIRHYSYVEEEYIL
ncbi:MAG: hypothetical protein ACP5NV_01625 [Candidatus Woesearchaeota archaeon]